MCIPTQEYLLKILAIKNTIILIDYHFITLITFTQKRENQTDSPLR